VRTSWTEGEVTWNRRKTDTSWTTAGGDLGSKLDDAVVSNQAGTKVTFDVTSLVRDAVAGRLGSSRYTRVALLDLEGSTSASYREFYLPNDSNVANRPTLKVTYGSTSSSPALTVTGTTLRVLHWNTHHNGVGTDGVLDTARLMRKVATLNADVISLNEVERYSRAGATSTRRS
jgi:hypothetical protein